MRIIKQSNYVISEKQIPEVMQVISSQCEKKQAHLHYTSEIEVKKSTLEGQTFNYENKLYSIRSFGLHQPDNAAAAIDCAYHLGFDYDSIQKASTIPLSLHVHNTFRGTLPCS